MQHKKKKINARKSERCSDLPFLSLSVTHEAQVVRPKDNRGKIKKERRSKNRWGRQVKMKRGISSLALLRCQALLRTESYKAAHSTSLRVKGARVHVEELLSGSATMGWRQETVLDFMTKTALRFSILSRRRVFVSLAYSTVTMVRAIANNSEWKLQANTRYLWSYSRQKHKIKKEASQT